MDAETVRTILAAADNETPPRSLEARKIEAWGGGGSQAWKCDDEDGRAHIVKAANNGQDRALGPRLKVVTTELICGRIATLFSPPMSPEVHIMTIPAALAGTITYPGTTEHPTPGPAFASRFVAGKDTKAGGQASLIGTQQAARLAVLQTWLAGEDVVALIPDDGGAALSVDHGYYLTGSQWDEARFGSANPLALVRLDPNPVPDDHCDAALRELEAIGEEQIVAACACIPAEWGAEFEFRATLAEYILRRRPLVSAALAALRRT